MERSWLSDYLVFARANLTGIHLTTYEYTFSILQQSLGQNVIADLTILYLYCPVSTAMARMHNPQTGKERRDGSSEYLHGDTV